MAIDQEQSEWPGNKELNIKENSPATADGVKIPGDDIKESWRPTDDADNVDQTGAQKPFGEEEDPDSEERSASAFSVLQYSDFPVEGSLFFNT